MLQGMLEQAERDGVIIVHRPLGEATGGGACCWIDGRPVVYLDPRLPATERAEVLAHELAHVARGHLPRPRPLGRYAPVVAREEAACDRHAAAMLVDLDWLADVMAMANDDGLTISIHDVAEEADVTVAVAERAMRLVETGPVARLAG